MKKIFVILWALIGFNLHAQSFGISKGETSTETPTVVTKQFKKDYPSMNPTWSKEGYNYRADYLDAATNMAGMVVYSSNGRTLKSETELQANSYPGAIGDYHTSSVPGNKYKVYSTKDTTGFESYYTTSNGETFYFDKNGHFKGRVNSTAPAPTGTLTR